jgi:hypothetical protein
MVETGAAEAGTIRWMIARICCSIVNSCNIGHPIRAITDPDYWID